MRKLRDGSLLLKPDEPVPEGYEVIRPLIAAPMWKPCKHREDVSRGCCGESYKCYNPEVRYNHVNRKVCSECQNNET